MKPDLNYQPGNLFGDAGHLPCTGWMTTCLVTPTTELSAVSIQTFLLAFQILLFRIWLNWLFILRGPSLLYQVRLRVCFFFELVPVIEYCLVWSHFVFFFLLFMSPVCTGCHIVCTAEIHTNINLTEATCFCTLRKKRLHVQKLLHMNALSEEEALPLKSLAYFLDSRHTFSISVENSICWWKSASHPSWVDAEQWVDEMWLLTASSGLRICILIIKY